MIIEEEIIDFLNMIIMKAKNKEELSKNINTYKDYLVLTGICNDEVLNFIGNIKNKADKIFELKEYFNYFDVRGIISEDDISNEERTVITRSLEKHYHHYIRDNNSSGCGSNYSSNCGTKSTIYRDC
jgi:hypothetical protein